jgi:hypothetical protein
MAGIPATITIITEKIGAGHIKSDLPGFFMLDVKIPGKRDNDGNCPTGNQYYAVKYKS